MSKGTETFKKTIQQYLEKRAGEDSLFAETLKKENKSIDECVNYILSEVQKSGCNGFADEEIFGMAVHYFDEDDVKPGSAKSMKVIVNHHVELTEEEKAIAKEKAMELAVEDAKDKAIKKLVENIELSTEEIESAKQQAIEKVVSEQKEKLVKKKSTKKVEISNDVEQDLFS
jgi:PcfK-like protein